MPLPRTATSTEPLRVVLVDLDGEEEARIDGEPIERAEGETARQAALRQVMTGAPREVDIVTPSGVVLHTRVVQGRVDVLGQSTLPVEVDERSTVSPETPRTEAASRAVEVPSSAPQTPPGSAGPAATDDVWAERDFAWPVPDTGGSDRFAGSIRRLRAPLPRWSLGRLLPRRTSAAPPSEVVDRTEHERPDLTAVPETGGADTPEVADGPDPADRPAEPHVDDEAPTTTPPERVAIVVDNPPAQDRSGQAAAASDHGAGSRVHRPRPVARRWVRAAGSRRAVAVLAALLVLAAIGIGAAQLLREDPPPTVTVAAGGVFPGTPPQGWSAQAAWSSPPLLTDTPVTMVGTDEGVAFITAEGALSVVDAASGATRWAMALPDGDVTAGPEATVVHGVAAVAVAVGDRAVARAADDGRMLIDARIPPTAEMVLSGPTPFLRDGSRAGLFDGRDVAWIDLPAGATALAARGDGTLLAGGPAGWWHLRQETLPADATPWEQIGSPTTRPTSPPVMVGALGTFVLVVHPDDTEPRLVVHEDGRPLRASFQSGYIPGRNPVWAPSPSETWGILGRSLVDLQSGAVTDLGDWQTVLVANEHAYGLIGDQLALVRSGGTPEPVSVQTSLVEATGTAGGLARVDSGGSHTVWMLPPAP
ncbi:MAG: hypothetical protein Q4G43_02915 [Mobilicoccus sp.]|nr:hypothetical protein [Mobilicoccus sp.]